jgi:2-polyprenyl-3-methyl-5-hydroxy-6-metoxy-1,4-benzoquinol methylase
LAKELPICRCNKCKNIYLGRYDLGYIDELYEYYQKDQGKSSTELFSEQTQSSYRKALDLISRYTIGRSILDVGCGRGDFVYAALNNGWDVRGIELAKPAVKIAESFNLPVNHLDFFSDTIGTASYDVVTMFEVLEHLPDPVSFLMRAEAVLRPGGLLYLTTPNFRCLDRLILGLNWPVIHAEHLTYFTPNSLRSAIAAKTNLTVLHDQTRNISIQSIEYIKSLFARYLRLSDSRPIDYPYVTKPVDFRATIESSFILRSVKKVLNGVLNITSTGNTIILLLMRPKEEP